MVKTYSNSSKILTMTKGERPIVYKPIYVDITGSKNSAILLYQILFWCDWMNGEFYKSDKEFSQMIGLSYDELRIAKKKLKGLGFIKAIQRGFPAKTYYSIGDQEFLKIREALIKQNSYLDQQFLQSAQITQTEDQTVDNYTPVCANYTLQSAQITQTVHYIQRSIKNNPSIGFRKDKNDDDTNQPIGEGDGLNQIMREKKVTDIPVDQSVDNFNKITDDSELDRQTTEFIKIWPDISKKPGFKLVREALGTALTKKSFAGLCEHARDFVSVQRRKRSDEYITCAHTWLNQERWPKYSQSSPECQENPYAQQTKDVAERFERYATQRVTIEKAIIKAVGEEVYNNYFHWKVCSISLRTDPISFLFDCDSMRKYVEKTYSQLIQEIINGMEELSSRSIEFKSTLHAPSKKLFDGFSSRKVLDEIKNFTPGRNRELVDVKIAA